MVRSRVRRLPRHLYLGDRTCAFTVCCEGRVPKFQALADIEPHVERLALAAEEYRCLVPIYCFMPDHLHVMFKGLGDGADTLGAMTKFKLLSGLWFDRTREVAWQKGFYDHVVRGVEDWRNHATYIAMNPVRAGMVESPFEYPLLGTIGCDLSEVILRWEV